MSAAVEWAVQMHGDQRRAVDRAPFILHPLEVASLLSGRGFEDEVIAAGVLHDIVENTAATVADVGARFGPRVASIVAAVSEDPSISDYVARKAALRSQASAGGVDARAVYAADKISKTRELRSQAARDPAVLVDPQNRVEARALRGEPRGAASRRRRAADGRPVGVRAVGPARVAAPVTLDWPVR